MSSPRSTGLGRAVAFAALGGLLVWQIWSRRAVVEDAFIAFRYADHWARGLGLVWNPGERVEGYTEFSWVLLLGVCLKAGIAPETASVAVGAACGFTLWILVCRASLASLASEWALVPAAAFAASRSMAVWATGGLATMAYALLVFLALRAYASAEDRRVPWASAAWLALATLTRPDGAVFATAIGLCLCTEIAVGRRTFMQGVAWAAAYLVPVVAHLAFRVAYYDAWLPNTFYAKVDGAWWSQGFTYLGLFADHYWALLWLPACAWAWRGERPRWVAPWSCSVVLYTVYLASVGGDLYEFRFLVPILPLAWMLAARGCAQLWTRAPGSHGVRLFAVALALMAVGGSARSSWLPDAQQYRAGIFGPEEVREYTEQRVRDGERLRKMIDAGLLPPDFVLATAAAGAVPYYSRLPTLDFYGLSDAHVARQRISRRGQVGHEKTASNAYMHGRGVEAFDILNRLVVPRAALKVIDEAQDALARHHQRDPGPPGLHFVCRDVGNGYVFVFASSRSDEELNRRLPRLPPCS